MSLAKYLVKAGKKLDQVTAKGIKGGAKAVVKGDELVAKGFKKASENKGKVGLAVGAAGGAAAASDSDDDKKKKKKRPYMED